MSTKEMLAKEITPAKKKVAKKKVATKKKVAKKQAAPEDLIQDTAHQVENLTASSAFKLVHTLVEDAEFNYFKLGGVLLVIQENSWWEDYPSFRDYINEQVGIPYRKALYLIEIYQALVASEVSWSMVSDVGWTKLKELAKVLTKDNAEEWVSIAKESTTLQLIERIKAYKAMEAAESSEDTEGEAPVPESDVVSNPVTTMTFKVHEDQKETIRMALDKAKSEGHTEYDSVALEYVAVSYLESTTGAPQKKAAELTPDLMVSTGLAGTLDVLDKAFPDVNFIVEVSD